MKRHSFLVALLLSGGGFIFAQEARFITGGNIEFEKTVNVYALIKNGDMVGKNTAGNERQLFEQYQNAQPQFKVLKSTLYFSDDKTLFIPAIPRASVAGFPDIPMIAQNNTVYTDLSAHRTVARKIVFGEPFLLNDSVRNISWKITGETREVAGYTCRRANALIMDSMYVVAFYTEKIHVAGGPESFSGLPGMILELALPHEHVIWRATKVTDTAPAQDIISPPQKGKPVDRQQLLNMLQEAVKDRNARMARLIIKVNLL